MAALIVISVCLAVGIVVVLWVGRVRLEAAYTAPITCDEVHIVDTPDSWRIRLYRHRARKGVGEPVFLCHGFMSNQWNFSIPPGESMADVLAEEGYDCWLIDLRGARSSIPPQGGNLDNPSVDDYLLKDIPAAIDYICRTTGYDKVHWVGHSMGGMLLYAYDAVFGAKALASATTLGAPIGFRGFKFKHPAFLFFIRRNFPGLFRCGQRMLVSFVNCLHPNLQAVPVNWKNMNRKLDVRALYSAIEMPPVPVAESLAHAAAKGIWRVKDDMVDVFENLGNLRVPLFAVFGKADPFIPVDTIEGFFEAVPVKEKRMLVLSKDNGHSADYSHVDLVMGPEIRAEVVAPMIEWFKAHSIAVGPSAQKGAVPVLTPILDELAAAVAVLDGEPAAAKPVAKKKAAASAAKKPAAAVRKPAPAAARKAGTKKESAPAKKTPAKKPAAKAAKKKAAV